MNTSNMYYKQSALIIIFSTFFIFSTSAFRLKPEEQEGDYKGTLPFFHGSRPILSIFSKPADPEAPKLTGPNIIGHVGNVMHGGTIGIQLEMKPMTGFHGLIGNAKKIIPGGQTYPQVGKPEHQKPPSEPYDPPKHGSWENSEELPEKDGVDEHEEEWIPEDPKKPVPEGPSWEDIGEDPEDDPSIPYEEIINPRVRPQNRPKRSYSNSKIYHVPLKFVSNAKPFQLRFMNKQTEMRQADKNINRLLWK